MYIFDIFDIVLISFDEDTLRHSYFYLRLVYSYSALENFRSLYIEP